MKMSALAKHRNSMPKENSKSQEEKRKKAEERYRPRICCQKCKATNKTLYNIRGNYYCLDCKDKLNKTRKNEKGITMLALIITVIVLIIIAGAILGVALGGIGINLSDYQNSIMQKQKIQEDCQHEWVITSKYDYFRECYKTISKCSKCGKEVE